MIKTGIIATILATLIAGTIAFLTMNALPETGQIPIHWNHKGEADGFASAAEARKLVWIMPGLTVLTGAILALAVKIDPRRQNIQKSSRAYLAVWIGTLVLMVVISALIGYSMTKGGASTRDMAMAPGLIVAAISGLFVVIGNYLPKTRSNWFFGIRTPWTLSSEEAWEKTHRITGRLFIGLGIAGLISVFLLPVTWQLPIIVGGSLAITAFALIYSYLTWRTASDRSPAPDYIE